MQVRKSAQQKGKVKLHTYNDHDMYKYTQSIYIYIYRIVCVTFSGSCSLSQTAEGG